MSLRPLVLLLPALGLLGGCANLRNPLQGALTNRVVISVAEDECLAASRWGPIAITGDVDERDCTVIVQALRLRQLLLSAAAARGGPAASAPMGY
ncbi:MAG TPA: hypothetical protein PLF63_04795 [Rubrivivax sp.]|jgi:hypothetical protein|nr:hypothetical protein [Rubrivivax sp.]